MPPPRDPGPFFVATHAIRRAAAGFRPSSAPVMARSTYRAEALTACTMPVALVCLDMGTVEPLLANAFPAAPDLVVSAGSIAPHVGFLMSVWLTRWIRGRDRVRSVCLLQLGVLVSLLCVAATPSAPWGVFVMLGAVYAARIFAAGLVTARTDVWRSNYPDGMRAKLTGRIETVSRLTMFLGLACITLLLQQESGLGWVFRSLFLGAVCVGLVGVWSYSRVRWRGGAAARRQERADDALQTSPASLRGMLGVLRDDRLYRGYMLAMFALGMANLAGFAPMALALRDEFGLGFGSLWLTRTAPLGAMVVSIPLWARLLDGRHVIRFRAVHVWVFVVSLGAMSLGLFLQSLWVMVFASLVQGAGFGGGVLAWQLGHHDFAPRRLASVYMSVHVTLTGARGLVAPFVGVWLYSGWSVTLLGERWAWSGLGAGAFACMAACAAMAGLLFLWLRAAMARDAAAGAV